MGGLDPVSRQRAPISNTLRSFVISVTKAGRVGKIWSVTVWGQSAILEICKALDPISQCFARGFRRLTPGNSRLKHDVNPPTISLSKPGVFGISPLMKTDSKNFKY